MKKQFNVNIINYLIVSILLLVFVSCNDKLNLELKGNAVNTTFNKKSSVVCTIMELNNGKYHCIGKFDELTLWGRFDLLGKKIDNPNAPDALSIYFEGDLKLGNDGSGFSEGTRVTFTLVVNIYSDNASGEYLIHEIPNSSYRDIKQKGVIDFYRLTNF